MNITRSWLPYLGLLVSASVPIFVLADEPDKATDNLKAQHLARMKALAFQFELYRDATNSDSQVELASEPVLRYSDSTRLNNEATMWIWSSGGRPIAVLAVELYPDRGPSWLYEIASLAPTLISAKLDTRVSWTAKKPGLEFQPLADASPPAAKAAARLAQMRALRGRFSAHESEVIEGRVELRPLSSPLYRYTDDSEGIIDAAIFAFANGTNPEVLLVLEAHASKDSPPEWQFGIVQMTGGALHVRLDNQEVWKCGEAEPPATRDSYVNGWLPIVEQSK